MTRSVANGEVPTADLPVEIPPKRIECQWCGRFLFTTYFAHVKVKIKCVKCSKFMQVEMGRTGIQFQLA